MVHIIFLIALFCMIPELNKKYPFRFFTYMVLFLFMSLRYNYGNDYMSYFNMHASINASQSWVSNDFLFNILNLSIPNFFVMISIISLFYIITINYLIKNNLKVDQYWFGFLILLINPYLFLVQLSSLRQTLAICLFIFAVNFGMKRKLIPYVVFILLAVGMHKSAIILLPIYFILTEEPFKKKHLVLTSVILLSLVFTPLFDLIVSRVLEYMPKNYSYYYNQGMKSSLRATLISSFYFFLVSFNMHKLKGKEIMYGKLSLIATIISILSVKVSMVARVGMYFDIFMIITIPQIFNRIDKDLYKWILFIALTTIYLLRYYSFFSNPLWESFKGYKTILWR